MEIIFYQYGSICEPDMVTAFESLGITVIKETSEIANKRIDPEQRIKLLSELILCHHAAFVCSINYFPHIALVCEKLKILYVCQSVDCPVLELYSATLKSPYNRIFLFDQVQYQQLHGINPNCIFYLPLSANVARWDQISAKNTRCYQYDVSMVGSLYTEKSPYRTLSLPDFDKGYCDGLINAQRLLPGLSLLEETITPTVVQMIKGHDASFYQLPDAIENTDAFVAANYYLGMQVSSLERIQTLNALAKEFDVHLFTRSTTTSLAGVHCHDGVSTHQEMPEVFRNSKINLNITIRSIQSGLSQRIYDVLGCHGFLLTNYQSELPSLFEIGTDLDCYENVDELKEKIRFYLENEELREEIAEHGYRTVREKHTCLQRAVEIIRTICP